MIAPISILSYLLLLFGYQFENVHSFSARPSMRLLPSEIMCSDLTQSYPITLLKKLFSSVPTREYAIQDITLSIGTQDVNLLAGELEACNNFYILVGRSGCGKSTLLRVLSGDEEPASGNVLLNRNQLYPLEKRSINQPIPIMLDAKPDCFNDKLTVLQRIEEVTSSDLGAGVRRTIAIEFANLLSLSEDEINANPSSLSPSAQYVFGIACACVQSTADAVYVRDDGDIELPCPILLLDELIDFETSIVANRIGKSLKELSRAGAVIITATHRPQYLKSFADRMITLSSGMILLSEKL